MSKIEGLLIKDTTEEENELIRKIYPEETTHFRVGSRGFIYPERFRGTVQHIHDMEVRASDVFVMSYPRSGTTWTQEMVWLIANDLDFDLAKSIPLHERYHFPEFSALVSNYNGENTIKEDMTQIDQTLKSSSMDTLKASPDPRFIKIHTPLSILPPGVLKTSKVVYVARDPRDVAVSFYHLGILFDKVVPYTGSFKEMWNLIRKDMVYWSPIIGHVKDAWQMRNHPNLLFLFYEEMSKDLHSAIRRVSSFLGKEYNEEQVQALANHLSIDNFKKNAAVQLSTFEKLGMLNNNEKFIRKGKVGGWRDYFDEEMTQQAEAWIAENLKDTDLRFPSF